MNAFFKQVTKMGPLVISVPGYGRVIPKVFITNDGLIGVPFQGPALDIIDKFTNFLTGKRLVVEVKGNDSIHGVRYLKMDVPSFSAEEIEEFVR